jgi:hypothetical protein
MTKRGAVGGVSAVSPVESIVRPKYFSQSRRNIDLQSGALGFSAAYPFASPKLLFDSGQAGVWYDFSDPFTLFQDAAGTIPVEVVGDPVGRVVDKSGNGNDLVQETDAARPVWSFDPLYNAYGILCDGVDDSLASTDVVQGFTGSPSVSVLVGARKQQNQFQRRFVQFGGSRGFELWGSAQFGQTPLDGYTVSVNGSGLNFGTSFNTAFNPYYGPGHCAVFAHQLFMVGAGSVFRDQGEELFRQEGFVQTFAQTFLDNSISVFPPRGFLFQVVVTPGTLTPQQIDNTSRWISRKMNLVR